MMTTAPIHLVGSVPGANTEAVLRTCGPALGNDVFALPDGETGTRKIWVVHLAHTVFDPHPDLRTLSRPRPVGSIASEWRAPGDDWVPSSFDDVWVFRVADGVATLHFDKLFYAQHALASYATFTRLRDEGVIGARVRFMVCLPLPESAVRWFVINAEDYATVALAYAEALRRELKEILAAIPSEDLCIQWDVCMEVLAMDVDDNLGRPPIGFSLPETPEIRLCAALGEFAPLIDAAVPMGLHLCYGDLGHVHLVEPKDLNVCVRLSNATVASTLRPIDFIHMPVPRERCDAPYFAPLRDLDIGTSRVYLGLVHHSDGVAGTRRRVAAAREALPKFGISTECGFGRRPAEQVPELLNIHRTIAAELEPSR